jgi:ArsR family transcriptional regulator, arsenate/arsenite/antimonite-responsive transcriptional repressor
MKRSKTSSPSCSPALARPREADRRPLDGPAAEADLAAFAKAASHPIRVKILHMLARRDAQMCCHIVDELPLAQSTVSEHLRILRSAGLIKANEKGPRVAYCIVPAALKRFKALLNGV